MKEYESPTLVVNTGMIKNGNIRKRKMSYDVLHLRRQIVEEISIVKGIW